MLKKTYRVREGVTWVNGARVPASRKVELTEIEARFEWDHGRIEALKEKTRPAPSSGAEPDGGN